VKKQAAGREPGGCLEVTEELRSQLETCNQQHATSTGGRTQLQPAVEHGGKLGRRGLHELQAVVKLQAAGAPRRGPPSFARACQRCA